MGRLIYKSLISQGSQERALMDISPFLRICYGSRESKVLLPAGKHEGRWKKK